VVGIHEKYVLLAQETHDQVHIGQSLVAQAWRRIVENQGELNDAHQLGILLSILTKLNEVSHLFDSLGTTIPEGLMCGVIQGYIDMDDVPLVGEVDEIHTGIVDTFYSLSVLFKTALQDTEYAMKDE
jgi:hypothetical protein